MKKNIILFVALISLLVFSGCSIFPSGKKKSANPNIKQGSMWKTVDGGSSFEVKSALEPPQVENEEEVDDKEGISKPQIVSSDILDITFHPDNSNVIYASTVNAGIFKTENSGESWKHIDFPPQKIYSFTLDRNDPDNRMFASGVLYGTGKILRTEDGGDKWKEAYSEPGKGTLVTSMSQHKKDPNVIFAGTSGGTVIKSLDGGFTWRNIGQKIDGPVTEIPFDAEKKFSVYALSLAKKIHYSEDGGEKWIDWEEEKKEEIKEMRKKEAKLRSEKLIAAADKLKKIIEDMQERNKEEKRPQGIISLTASSFISGTLYAGTKSGGLYISEDYGKYWKKFNIIESASAFPIRMITASHSNKDEISFISGMAFYKSLNSGDSWAVAQLNVNRPVSVISYDPKDSNVIYLGLATAKK